MLGGRTMIGVDTIANWVNQIGDYDLQSDNELKEQLGLANDALIDINNFISPAAKAKLFQSTHEDDPEPTRARILFLQFIGNRFQNIVWDESLKNKTVKLEEFLGEQGLALYKAAVEEESKSKAFREAVFLKALTHFPGHKWAKKLILWVGGPSSSGKTYGAKGVIKTMDNALLPKTTDESGNKIVSIDGSFEREVSQMRQMVLQLALAHGYKGIKNLHKHSKSLVVKGYLREAAIKDDNLSLVIPDTFAYRLSEAKEEFREYEALDPRAIQAFSEVTAEKGHLARFQTSVKKMGDARAWNSSDFKEVNIKMNNRKIGCESKIYQAKFFIFGYQSTKIFKRFYKSSSRDKITLTVSNDLIYLKKEDGVWKECEFKDDLTGKKSGVDFIRMTARAYNYWKDNNISTPLNEWYENIGKHTKKLTEQVITYKDNKKSGYSNLASLSRPRKPSFFRTDAEQERKNLRHQIDVNEEMINGLEEEMHLLQESEETSQQIASLNKKLSRCKDLQNALKAKLATVDTELKETEEARKQEQIKPQFLPYVNSYEDISVLDKQNLLDSFQTTTGNNTPDTQLLSSSTNENEFLAPKLKEDECRVHFIDITSNSKKAIFIQEKIPDTTSGVKFTAVENSVGQDSASLVEYSLAMASSLLLSMDSPPSTKNPIILKYGSPEMLRHLWTALMVLGENVPGWKFDQRSIKVISTAFIPELEFGRFRGYSDASLHETVFKTYRPFIMIKVDELKELIKLKESSAEQAKMLGEELTSTLEQAESLKHST